MQALGFNCANQTVAKVEKPNGPLLAAEVLALAVALETTISDLMAAARGACLRTGRQGNAVLGSAESQGIRAGQLALGWPP